MKIKNVVLLKLKMKDKKIRMRYHEKSKVSKYIKNVKDNFLFECTSNYLSKALIILLSFLF